MEDFDKRTEVIQIRELIKEKAKIAAANQKRSIEKTKYLISLELFDQFFYF